MGLKDSPMSFCRIINQVLIGLTGHNTHVYLDDIIVQGIDLMDNIDNLEKVFLRLQESKLKVNLKKCTFFKSSVKYLGHVVSAEGLKPQPNKIEAVNKMSTPKTVKELQSFLGLTLHTKPKHLSLHISTCIYCPSLTFYPIPTVTASHNPMLLRQSNKLLITTSISTTARVYH